jgi:hypothetical protein
VGWRSGCGFQGGFGRRGGFVELAAFGFDGGFDVNTVQGAGGDHFGGEVADGLDHGFDPGDGFLTGVRN